MVNGKSKVSYAFQEKLNKLNDLQQNSDELSLSDTMKESPLYSSPSDISAQIEEVKNSEELEESIIKSIVIKHINSKDILLSGEAFLFSVFSEEFNKDSD